MSQHLCVFCSLLGNSTIIDLLRSYITMATTFTSDDSNNLPTSSELVASPDDVQFVAPDQPTLFDDDYKIVSPSDSAEFNHIIDANSTSALEDSPKNIASQPSTAFEDGAMQSEVKTPGITRKTVAWLALAATLAGGFGASRLLTDSKEKDRQTTSVEAKPAALKPIYVPNYIPSLSEGESYVYVADQAKPTVMIAANANELIKKFAQNETCMYNSDSSVDRQSCKNFVVGNSDEVVSKAWDEFYSEVISSDNGLYGSVTFENIVVEEESSDKIIFLADRIVDRGSEDRIRGRYYFTNYPLSTQSARWLLTGTETIK